MSDEHSSNGSAGKTWLGRLTQAFTGEPRDRDQLVEQLREAHKNDILEADALSMIEGALDVSETQVREAMVPRGQMVVIPSDVSADEILPMIIESGHSRFPVIGEDKDEIVGILLAKDMLKVFAGDKDLFNLRDIMRKAVFIPESKRLNVLLAEFRNSRNHMAIVVDEYGGVSGLITIEDVLEEIVGEIDDEHDDEEIDQIRAQEDGSFVIDALTPLQDFDDQFGSTFSDAEEAETVGGMVMKALGHVPVNGETVSVEGFDFRILGANERRISSLSMRAPSTDLHAAE